MTFNNIQINFAPGPHTRIERMDGREYLVAPMVMLTVGVHNGSNGPILYTADELAKTPETWNMKPLVVYHPTQDGQGISACTLNVIETQGVGMIMNARWDGKLRAEAWFDIDKVARVDNRILEALEQGKLMEVSTGLFTDNEQVEGTFEPTGERYVAIARNFRADHLAILPDRIGACSIKDGAGLLQTNELSNSDTRQRLEKAVQSLYGRDVWVMDVFTDWFVFARDGLLFKAVYEVANDLVTISPGMPEAVVVQTAYRTVDGTLIGNCSLDPCLESSSKENPMSKPATSKTKLIDDLISNASNPFTKEDRAFLETKDDAFLEGLMPAAVTEPEPEAKVKEQPVGNQAKPTTKLQSVDEYINNAPAGMQDVLRHGLNSYTAERMRLVSTIVANEHNTYTEAELQSLPHDQLQKLASFVAANTKQPEPMGVTYPNYAGAGAVPLSNVGMDMDPLEVPFMW